MPRRDSKGRFLKKGHKRKGKKGRSRNSAGVDILAVNAKKGGKHRRRGGVGGFLGGLGLDKIMPDKADIAAGLGMLATESVSNLIESKVTTKEPGSIFSRVVQAVGGAYGGKLVARVVGMIPVKAISEMAPIMAKMAWPTGTKRGIQTIALPLLPEKVRGKLAEFGLRGHVPSPLRGYVVDAETGQMYGLNGCDVRALGHVKGIGTAVDGLADHYDDSEEGGLGDDFEYDDA